MVIGHHRKTQVLVDLQAIRHNIREFRRHLNPNQQLYAVVKADAYGHGMIPVAKAASQEGVDGFCVAILDEGLALRQAGLQENIMILGLSLAEDYPLLVQNQLAPAVGQIHFLQACLDQYREGNPTLPIHLALDTGMGRIGFRQLEDLQVALDLIIGHPQVFRLEGVFTHFATADEEDRTKVVDQEAKLQELLQAFGQDRPRVHDANSAYFIWHDRKKSDIVRMGIALYGENPSSGSLALPKDLDLRPALTWETQLVEVKKCHAGETISYGATYTLDQDQWIGTLPVGYADGWLRAYQGVEVLIEGQACPIVGRICMDQCMVLLPKEFSVGTKVTLIGENGGKILSANQIAKSSQTINYEVYCSLGHRVPRYYQD